jgi:hypothetical protein
MSSPLSGAMCTDGLQSGPLTPTYESAISVGAANAQSVPDGNVPGTALGALNYPSGTVLCCNSQTGLACLYTDWPAQGETSGVAQCQCP